VGGEVDIQVGVLPEYSPNPPNLTFPLFIILTALVIMALLAVAVYRRRQHKKAKENNVKAKKGKASLRI